MAPTTEGLEREQNLVRASAVNSGPVIFGPQPAISRIGREAAIFLWAQQLKTVALRNFPLTALVLSLLAAIVSMARRPRADRDPREEMLAFFLLFGVGFGFLYSGAMHIFFGPMVARFIGWADSPFQAEVGFASLGFGVVGILAFRGSFGLRLAAVIGPAVFALAPGNAGVAFFSDLIGPVLGLALLWLRYGAHSAYQQDARGPTKPRS